MTKLTFRADADLVDRLEALDASKSEVMRDALREYLDADELDPDEPAQRDSLDDLVAERVDAMIEERSTGSTHDVDITITVEPPASGAVRSREAVSDANRADRDDVEAVVAGRDLACPQCGTAVDADHEYCPNCGEQRARRPVCQCGEEIRSDWSFCPSCGGRTPAADVLDRS